MSPNYAARIAGYARKLVAEGLMTPIDYKVFDTIFWVVRKTGQWDASVSYADIARLSGCRRDAAIQAVARLQVLGVLIKERRWTLVHWGRNKAQVAARRAANCYIFPRNIFESVKASASAELDILFARLDRKAIQLLRESPFEQLMRRVLGCGEPAAT